MRMNRPWMPKWCVVAFSFPFCVRNLLNRKIKENLWNLQSTSTSSPSLSWAAVICIFLRIVVFLPSEKMRKVWQFPNLDGISYFLPQWTYRDISLYKSSLVIFFFLKWHLHAFLTLPYGLFNCPSQYVSINIDLILVIFSLWACHSVLNLNFQPHCHPWTFMPIVRWEKELNEQEGTV